MYTPNFYVVFVGRKPGIYKSFEDVQNQIQGFTGSAYKTYKNFNEAASAEALFYEAWQSTTVMIGDNIVGQLTKGAQSVEDAMNYVNANMPICMALSELLSNANEDSEDDGEAKDVQEFKQIVTDKVCESSGVHFDGRGESDGASYVYSKKDKSNE